MSSLQIARFREDIPTSVADQVADLFERTYPSVHEEEERSRDLRRHSGAAAVQSIVRSGADIYTATTEGDVVKGFIESRTIDQPQWPHAYEVLTWISVEQGPEGLSVANRLHDYFMMDATERAQSRMPRPTLATVSVHSLDPNYDSYRERGYRPAHTTLDRKVVMTQPVVPRVIE